METWTLFLGSVGIILLALVAIRRYRTGRWLRKIRGPPSPSFTLGHIHQLLGPSNVGDLEDGWLREYGSIFRLKGCLGTDELFVGDPKALQYMLHKSGYHFPKTHVGRQLSREINGDGILFAMDKEHARIRKIMNPAFSAGQLRSFLPHFRHNAHKLSQKWTELLQDGPQGGKRINVLNWLTRCTLDVICKTGFDIECGALDDSMHPIIAVYNNMFADSMPCPSRFTIFFRAFWPYIPMSILQFVKYIPTKDHTRFRYSLNAINAYAKTLVRQKTEALLAGTGSSKKDILSILIQANHAEDPKHRISDKVMISMMTTFLLAGHETTGVSLAWLLYELAKHPEYQSKMRAEIMAMRARVTERGDSEFTTSDLDAMQYTIAAMKELWRVHPIVYMMARMAAKDDVLPLASPITTTEGEVVNEIPIPRGTITYISAWVYNRLPQIWGPDAHEFNPMRFVGNEKIGETNVGMVSNLMTFSAGLQGCIGWRFAMIESQVILVELIEHFEFSIPEDKPEMVRLPAGVSMPLVKGDEAAGVQMPLRVSLVK